MRKYQDIIISKYSYPQKNFRLVITKSKCAKNVLLCCLKHSFTHTLKAQTFEPEADYPFICKLHVLLQYVFQHNKF